MIHRAKRIDNDEMVEGYYVHAPQPKHSEHEHCLFDVQEFEKGECFAFCFRYIHPETLRVKLGDTWLPVGEVDGILGMSSPWNLVTCAKALVLAVDHFHNVHNCDHHGHEEVSTAARMMKKHIANIEKAISKAKGGSE